MKKLLIKIGNSFCEVVNHSSSEALLLKEALTYDNQEVLFQIKQLKTQMWIAYRKKDGNKINYLKWKISKLSENTKICWFNDDSFPTGHLGIILNTLINSGIDFTIDDLRIIPKKSLKLKWKENPPSLRPYQKEMVAKAKKEHRGVFEAAVGSGKTLVMQSLVKEFDTPALIVTPSRDLCVQTFDSFAKLFGKTKVMVVNSESIKKKLKPIRIVTIHSLNSLKKKGKLTDVTKDLGLICIDEVHHSGAKSYTDLLEDFEHIYYRFGFSGTFMRNDSKTLDMWGFLSTVLYRYSAAQATKEGYLTPLKVKVHMLRGAKSSNYQGEYRKNYCENVDLLNKILEIINIYTKKEDQILILVKQKDKAGKLIHKYLKERGLENLYISGDDKRSEIKEALSKFNEKKVRILIGSTIIGEGIDIRSTDHLIMAQGGKSEIAITQAVGRAVRLFPDKEIAYIHDFDFSGTKYLTKHLTERIGIYVKNFSGEVEG